MKYLIIIIILAFGISCVNPLKSWFRVTDKQDKTEQKITDNRDQTIEKAKSYVHGTGTALSLDPEPSKHSEVASDLNQRAELILGIPTYEDALIIDKIVAGLLSTNEQIRLKAQKDLGTKDKEIINLQTELEKSQGKLTQIEKEKDELGLQNSILGNRWASLVKWVKIIFWGIVIAIVLAVVSQILSVCVPAPYNNIFSAVAWILGLIGRTIFSLVPNSKRYANVVPKQEFDVSEKTLATLIDSLQTIRHKEINPQDVIPKNSSVKIKDIIDPILLNVTDKDITRPKIVSIKKDLGYI